MYTADIMVRAF